MHAHSLQSRPTLWDSMDCSPPGFSVYGDFPGKDAGVGWQHTALTYCFPNFESVCYSMSAFNCCFLTDVQVSQKTAKVVWCREPARETLPMTRSMFKELAHKGVWASGGFSGPLPPSTPRPSSFHLLMLGILLCSLKLVSYLKSLFETFAWQQHSPWGHMGPNKQAYLSHKQKSITRLRGFLRVWSGVNSWDFWPLGLRTRAKSAQGWASQDKVCRWLFPVD